MKSLHIFLYSAIFFSISILECSSEYLKRCLEGKYHKKNPGPEPSLAGQCAVWKNESCCTSNVTEKIQNLTLYGFNYHHCDKLLSEKCKKHFIQDLCFYECSPNVGPWITKTSKPMKMRNESFHHVPLCKEDCDAWYDDCKEEMTCAKNWITDLEWNGNTSCPSNACKTVEELYGNAKEFCEEIFNHSWKYSESKQCMKLWFNDTDGNPNDDVFALNIIAISELPIAPGKGVKVMSYSLPFLSCLLYLGVSLI